MARIAMKERYLRKHYTRGVGFFRYAAEGIMSTLQRGPDERVQVLDKDGRVRDGATEPDLDEETLIEMYRDMKIGRHFDQRAVSLQRQGRMGTFPPMSGQEGAQVGSIHGLAEEDWMIPSYREHAAVYARGVSLDQTLRYWMGDEQGNRMSDQNVFSTAVPIATQIPHATGMSWASKLKGEDRVFMCYFGDGATSEGDFHEGLNFAGVFDTPTVFFCNNNQWAISVPREKQTAADTIAQKAQAYGFEGVQVDGMDPLAVYQVTKAAVEKARNPDEDERRPTLIEAVQYRFGAHTTADDPSVYRDEDEVEEWKDRDPIPRLEKYLRNKEILDDERVESITSEIEDEVAEAIDAAESTERPDPTDIFEYAYADVPKRLREQREQFEQLRERHGDEELLE
jgi:pyruvate dehydrogenase E1 component alpha subunit